MKTQEEIARQRAYYAKRAEVYDTAHLSPTERQHDFAMALLEGMVIDKGFRSFLDVGSGSGNGMMFLKEKFNDAQVNGIEPVEAMRELAYNKGISREDLVEGDATAIQHPSGSFDCVLALGIMHHLPDPRKALAEMVRVADKAVFISDLNNFGCGSASQRLFARTLRGLGLWKPFQYVKNGFKYSKFSEGDGIHYSYSLLDDVPFFNQLGCKTYIFTTNDCSSPSPLWGASHVAVLALKK